MIVVVGEGSAAAGRCSVLLLQPSYVLSSLFCFVYKFIFVLSRAYSTFGCSCLSLSHSHNVWGLFPYGSEINICTVE